MPKPKKSLPIYSASQLKTWELCPRKWAWEYVAKFKQPPTPAMLRGTAMHKALERIYLEKTTLAKQVERGQCTPEIAAIAEPGLMFLPDARAKVDVERKLSLKPPHTRHKYRGYVDLSYVLTTGPVVLDHKTTSAKKWALTPETMTTDLQVALYAREALVRFPGTSTVDLRWVYYRTSKTPKAWVSRAVWSVDEVLQRFERVEQTADAVTDHRHEKDPLKYPYRPESCSAYGGCPHVTRCNLSPMAILKSSMSTEHPKRHSQGNDTNMDPLLAPKTNAAPATPSPQPKIGRDPSKVRWPEDEPPAPAADPLLGGSDTPASTADDPLLGVGPSTTPPTPSAPPAPAAPLTQAAPAQPSLLPPEAPTGDEATKPMTLDEAETGVGGKKKAKKKTTRTASKAAAISEHAEVFTRLAVACIESGKGVEDLRAYWDEYKMAVVAKG